MRMSNSIVFRAILATLYYVWYVVGFVDYAFRRLLNDIGSRLFRAINRRGETGRAIAVATLLACIVYTIGGTVKTVQAVWDTTDSVVYGVGIPGPVAQPAPDTISTTTAAKPDATSNSPSCPQQGVAISEPMQAAIVSLRTTGDTGTRYTPTYFVIAGEPTRVIPEAFQQRYGWAKAGEEIYIPRSFSLWKVATGKWERMLKQDQLTDADGNYWVATPVVALR